MKTLYYILFFVSLSAKATTYYVSNSGNNSSNGTSSATAWQTIAKVNATSFSPGDSILFKRGDVWREQLTIPSSGSGSNRIVFGAYGTGPLPVINAADIKTGWTNAGSNQWYINNPNPVTTRAMVVVNGVIYTEVSSLAALTSANKYFIDVSATPDRVYVYSTTDPSTLTAEVSAREYCVVTASGPSSKQHIIIQDLDVRYAGRGGIYLEGPDETQGGALNGDAVVQRCNAYANRLFGIVAYDHYDNVIMRNNNATYNGNGFYAWVSDEVIMQNNTSAHNIPYTVTATDGHGYGGYRSDNILIENNTSDDDADNIHVDCGSWGITFTMRYNKSYNSKFGSPNTPTMGFGSVGAGGHGYIYYNLLVNGASSGIEAYTTMAAPVDIYNNTIYADADHNTDGSMYFTNTANMNIKNNLIVRDHVSTSTEYTFANFNASQATSQDYNLYYFRSAGASPTIRNYYNGGTYTTMAAWRTATGKDANSLTVDPLLVNTGNNLSIQATSPAINAGTNVGLVRDIAGNLIVGNPDIGAYEYTATIRRKGRRASLVAYEDDFIWQVPEGITGNYSLQKGSPCINAGVSVGLAKDIDGKLIEGRPDIGCYEYLNALPLAERPRIRRTIDSAAVNNVFPNPTDQQLTITVREPSTVQVFTAAGRLLSTYNINKTSTIPLLYPSGPYLLKITGRSKSVTVKKIIIN